MGHFNSGNMRANLDKNHWGEPYPSSLPNLIKKADRSLATLLRKLKEPQCKILADLYAKVNGKMQRLNGEFEELGYMRNVISHSNIRTYNEIKGLYLFGQSVSGDIHPVYVGISRSILTRLRNHGWGRRHNQATLAYAMAASRHEHEGRRQQLSYEKISKEQKAIRQFKVAILPETSDYDLYFMEVYIAGKLKLEWNTFRTH